MKPLPDDSVTAVRSLHRRGYSVREIAKMTGLTPTQVRSVVGKDQ